MRGPLSSIESCVHTEINPTSKGLFIAIKGSPAAGLYAIHCTVHMNEKLHKGHDSLRFLSSENIHLTRRLESSLQYSLFISTSKYICY